MSALQEMLENNDFRYSLFIPPHWQEGDTEFGIIPFRDLLEQVSGVPGGYLLISALCKISTWHNAPSGALEWGFTMKQAFEALQEIGMSEDETFWFFHWHV